MSIPKHAPASFQAGVTVKWTLDAGSDYAPADGWVVTYYFTCATDHRTKAASNNGDGTHLVTLSTADTAAFTGTHYDYYALAAKAGEAYKVDEGGLDVLPLFTVSVDGRSHVKTVLDAIEALIEGKAARGDVASFSIAGRSISHMAPEELIRWREIYRAEYQRELRAQRIAKGLGVNSKVRVRFV